MHTNLKTTALTLCLALLGSAGLCRAALVIDVGAHELLPNTPGQKVMVAVSGGAGIDGLNFFAQVADGGPELLGTTVGPKITAVDLITGTIFSSNNLGQFPVQSFPQAVGALTLTDDPITIPAAGRIATLTLDTTGFSGGTWSLSLTGTALGNTDFAGVPVTITNGTLTVGVIPEPSQSLFVLGLTTGLLIRRGRLPDRRHG